MTRIEFVQVGLAATVLALAVPAGAQAPQVRNGTVTPRAAAPLATAFPALVAAHADTAWIGYAVPTVANEGRMCCGDGSASGWSGCRLEPEETAPRRDASPQTGSTDTVARLEPSSTMAVLFRVVDRQVERVRVVSNDCTLDLGGRGLEWIDGVRPADSVTLLETMVTGDVSDRRKIVDGAVAAIALHRDEAADAALARLVAPDRPEALRKRVTFWLGNARGASGLALLQRLLRDDPSVEVRKGAVFGLSQVKGNGGTEALLQTARTNPEPRVRAEAIFWLGQRAGKVAAGAITERIAQDPDTEVKKKAVFALSQLPPDEGVPLLIQVAKTNTNPAVRKQAMFWLGQSKDPRAVDFFGEVLASR